MSEVIVLQRKRKEIDGHRIEYTHKTDGNIEALRLHIKGATGALSSYTNNGITVEKISHSKLIVRPLSNADKKKHTAGSTKN